VVFCFILLMGALTYAFYNEVSEFTDELPAYSMRIRRALVPIISKFERIQKNAEAISPASDIPKKETEVTVKQGAAWPSYLVRGFDSIYSALIVAAVLPFLLFFMLAGRDQMAIRFTNIFQGKIDVPKFIADVGAMIRGFMLGNLVVGSIMAVGTSVVFLILGVKGAVTLGIISGFLNLIPFLGLVLATAVPEAAALLQFNTVGPFVWIALATIIFHLIAANLLIPKWIGSHLLVGPVAVTIGMLFWGWLWGVIGLLLALPLTAFVKLVADAHPSLIHLSGFLVEEPRPLPRWASIGENTLQRVGRRLVKPKASK
jgi:predicted PurR-regulated permease PerM